MASRERIVHALYEAAELEHDLMCTYLYAAFSLKDGEAEGLAPAEAAAVARWRRTIHQVAIEEMGHLLAVWNITSALGGTPRFGRGNFPLVPAPSQAREPVRLPVVPPTPTSENGVDRIEGAKLTLIYEGKKCIHSRFCVTGAPTSSSPT